MPLGLHITTIASSRDGHAARPAQRSPSRRANADWTRSSRVHRRGRRSLSGSGTGTASSLAVCATVCRITPRFLGKIGLCHLAEKEPAQATGESAQTLLHSVHCQCQCSMILLLLLLLASIITRALLASGVCVDRAARAKC